MTEFVEHQPEEIPLRKVADQRERAHRVLVVEGVHQAAFADAAAVHLPEEDDLPASDDELRPCERGLDLGDKIPDKPESELEAAGGRPLTG
jgi:hypothetical protein